MTERWAATPHSFSVNEWPHTPQAHLCAPLASSSWFFFLLIQVKIVFQWIINPVFKWPMNRRHMSRLRPAGRLRRGGTHSLARTVWVPWTKLSLVRPEEVPADPSDARSRHEWFTSITCTCLMSYFSPEGHWSPDNHESSLQGAN